MTDTTVAEPTVLTGQDAFDKLSEVAGAQEKASATDNGKYEAEQKAFEHKPLPVDLVSGWVFREWKQRHVMALVETNTINKDFDNGFRRNYEVVKAAIECDCFDKPTGVTPDVLLDMSVHDVAQLQTAITNHFLNLVYTPKN